MAKQAKYESDLDRISSLPDHILCQILSLISIKDAVRTSILSTRWTHLFSYMTTLDFDNKLLLLSPNNDSHFKLFVERLFFNPTEVTLERFRLNQFTWNDDYLCFFGWMNAILCRGVKEIDAQVKSENLVGNDVPTLPTHLFTCKSLVSLKLDVASCGIRVPSEVCLPNLRTLQLRNLLLSDGSVFKLISGCPVLEEFVLVIRRLPGNIRELNICNLSLKRLVLHFDYTRFGGIRDLNYVTLINAPSLVYFKYFDQMAQGYFLNSMNSLEQADIRVSQPYLYDEQPYDANRERGATNILQAICNVKSLCLSIQQAATVIRIMRPEPVLAFQNLVELEIRNEFGDWKGTWFIEFLHCVPNLKTLHLHLVGSGKKGIEPLPEEVPYCVSFRLKEIKVSYFCKNERMFEMLSYFLNHATYLEKLTIPVDSWTTKEEQLRITEKFSELPRNSKECQVVSYRVPNLSTL